MRMNWVLLRHATDLLLAAALFLVAVEVARTGNPMGHRAVAGVWCAAIAVVLVSTLATRRMMAQQRTAGMWGERAAFLAAMGEAAERGMSPAQFLETWTEKVHADVQAEVRAENGHRVGAPDGSHDDLP